METIAVNCSWADAQLAEDSSLNLHLPPELRTQISLSTGSEYLNVLALAARLPQCTDGLFLLYKSVFVDIVNRWTATSFETLAGSIVSISSLARILPFASYLKPHVRELLQSPTLSSVLASRPSSDGDLDEEQITSLLLALFRLLSFDQAYFETLLPPIFFSSLLSHDSLRVRYLAIECLSLVMHFADAFCESLLRTYIGKQPIIGTWEGNDIDFRLLKLWEEQRWENLGKEIGSSPRGPPQGPMKAAKALVASDLHTGTTLLGDVLLPRAQSSPSPPSTLVLTANARRALSRLGSALLEPKPILMAGPASSGKTSLVLEAARLLRKDGSMIILHLNEQTDAKSLIGLHASSPTDNTFVWQPGVLTRALQQGRWVLIEDIDRAPAEVLGVLRPIIENGELFIPARKQRVRAADGFRIVATVRASSSEAFGVLSRNAWLSNPKIWSILYTEGYAISEIAHLLEHRYPALTVVLETFLEVHEKVTALYRDDSAFKAAQSRTPSLRDLLKWCRRINKRVETQYLRLSVQPFPETFSIDIFKDAIDCYASHLSDDFLYNKVAASVAERLNISPQQMQYHISGSIEPVEDASHTVKIDRTSLSKVASRRSRTLKSPFADTSTSRKCLESISAGIEFAEPFLLVGETGVGKTSLIQHIAGLIGQKLTVINLSQQSEATDLLGGFKPVTTRSLLLPLVEDFNLLFDDTFSTSKNEKFQVALSKALEKQNWTRLLKLWQEAKGMAETALDASAKRASVNDLSHTSKRRKLATSKHDSLRQRWTQFTDNVNRIRPQIEGGDRNHAFAFVEGRLVQAVRNGEWVLLDEINLASSDTLDHIVSLLQDSDSQPPSILLTEAGDVENIKAHQDFRVFAAMNPATDTGKKDLTPGLRSRFTELYVHAGDTDLDDLTKIVHSYLGRLLDNDKRAATALGRAYLEAQKLNGEHRLSDGAGDLPHFSARSLVRCLLYTAQHCVSHGLRRAMFEGFAMSFFTVLSRDSEALLMPSMTSHILANIKNLPSFLAQQPNVNSDGQEFVAFRHHLIAKGPFSPDFQPHYIRTPSVERNLVNLARAASMRRFPILLQGPTSAGKTSMVEYLAKLSGNRFVRINNHEHTDLQEYLGSYMSDDEGKLRFKDGVLVDALRKGHWLVLDELNLAPSDVLEALNRLLDDNRELLIPETQEVIRPHPNFLLFATQNPAGLYGGRKRLSRALRNRFLEIHFDDIPEDELEIILRERAQIAPSFCTNIVSVYKKLSLQRQSSRLFEQRNSFATLRDLFRWASRPVDDREQLAYHGFMLLGERVRDRAERQIVKTTIEETMKVTIDESVLYDASAVPSTVESDGGIVWTNAMRRLFVLVSSALKNREPVLLVGETGCGKTQICQVVAAAFRRPLNIYNAHMNTETGDLIGSQRPVRSRSQLAAEVVNNFQLLNVDGFIGVDLSLDEMMNRFHALDISLLDPDMVRKTRLSIAAYQSLFEWSDGSLVRSMRSGEHFLLDEISLADDSVLERLNSVLEPGRTILLAEKGSMDNVVMAHPEFQFLATMNPGGDYGKRELSAALRNRLTEIWVPPLSEEADVLPILTAKLEPNLSSLAPLMLKFSLWFREAIHKSANTTIPLRDLLAWAKFVNCVPYLGSEEAFLHGAMMVYVDSVGANPAGLTTSASDVESSRQKCLEFLQTLVSVSVTEFSDQGPQLSSSSEAVQVGSFSLSRTLNGQHEKPDLVFEAPTTLKNTMRLVRALKMDRPVLLEGNPGVGKTAIVTALAQLLGKSFTRINLSDQTDLMDLFGADAPAENEALGRFSWKDGPLLQAMQSGGWVLLDEMNLASQSVLEGLNSCLDHRKEVYIAELDKTFSCHPDFTLFAAQNPHHQGSGRKGLPASFVNRFTVVYADPFKAEDLLFICRNKYPAADQAGIDTLVQVVARTDLLVSRDPMFSNGAPWEVNLRDISRWLRLLELYPSVDPLYHQSSIIEHRFRTVPQKFLVKDYTGSDARNATVESFYPRLNSDVMQVGLSFLERDQQQQPHKSSIPIPAYQLPQVKSIITALSQAWPVILVGSSGAGKTQIIRSLASVSGAKLFEVSMNAEIDTMDLLGGFEQYDEQREIEQVQQEAMKLSEGYIRRGLSSNAADKIQPFLELHQICQSPTSDAKSLLATMQKLAHVSSMDALADRLQMILNKSQEMRMRFVWNDGVLVDAVREGCWLVLDNANLCNASVLDRLNSLLEPNGQLILSEQHNAGEGVRSIRPHPDFRVIIIMDPRYGELSRAMRNRSLEIFLDANAEPHRVPPSPRYPWTASISRLRDLFAEGGSDAAMVPFVDNLAFDDLELVQSHPLSKLGPNQGLACAQAIVGNCKGVDETIWRAIHALTKPQININLPCALSNHYQPQKLTISEPLFSGKQRPVCRERTASLQRMWHLVQYVSKMSRQIETVYERATSNAESGPTALERSVATHGQINRNKHDIPPFFEFASMMNLSARVCIEQMLTDPSQLKGLELTSVVVLYVKDMLDFATSVDVDMAVLQALLQIGQKLAKQLSCKLVSEWADFTRALGLFKRMRLERGLGLQRMWHSWKPKTPTTLAQLEMKLAYEQMVDKFTGLVANLPQSKSELVEVKTKILEAAESSWKHEDAGELLQSMTQSMGVLEVQARRRRPVGLHFQATFDFIASRAAVLDHSVTASSSKLLRTFCSGEQMLSFWSATKTPVQQALHSFAVLRRHMVAEDINYEPVIVQKLDRLTQQPLRHLSRVQEEVQAIAKLIGSNVTMLSQDLLPSIKRQIGVLLTGILLTHQDLLSAEAVACAAEHHFDFERLGHLGTQEALQLRSEEDAYFRTVYHKHLQPAMVALASKSETGLGRALLHISLAALTLLVPDRAFDPALFEQVVLQRHQRRREDLHTKIEAQKAFNQHLMIQDSSLVLRLLEEELAELGDEPPISAVVRPEISTLSKVQEEFTNVLRNVINDLPEPLLQESPAVEHALAESHRINQIIDRLNARLGNLDRAYDDLVVPVAQLLQTLGLGAGLVASGMRRKDALTHGLEFLAHVPLLGAEPRDIIHWPLESVLGQASQSIFWLEGCASGRSLEFRGPRCRSLPFQLQYLRTIDHFYERWKAQLTKDQLDAEKTSRYYAYRDDDVDGEAEEKELAEMFPSFGEDGENPHNADSDHDGRGLAIQIARLHEQICAKGKDNSNLRRYIVEGLRKLNTEQGLQNGSSLNTAMPAILLHIEAEMHRIQGEPVETTINIYSDPSIGEAQKVIKLAQGIQDRFYEIGERWPEHAVPSEVVSFSDELLDLKLDNPLAKLLTKAEKLLEIMAQWQSVASREWSVASLIDDLTTLIVSWRRLELASWSRLLDHEKQKNEEDARAWYFIAYEAVIYNSRRVVETGGDVFEYSRVLVRTLEEFLRSTTLGQYVPRLRLLQMLYTCLCEAAEGEAGLTPASAAVGSVIGHYARYVPTIEKTLQTGRAEQERAVVEQIKLASWKDTNVPALRDSARRSHQKLFKIVRKYRALLGQPISALRSEELSSDQIQPSLRLPAAIEEPAQYPTALADCEAQVPHWHARPERLRTPFSSTSSLRHVYQTQISVVDVGAELATFREDLETSCKALRKETPPILTDDNSNLVRHLRERKRRLFAATVKDVTQMGVRRNLATSELEMQSSLATILSSSPDVVSKHDKDPDTSANMAFHELLDSMPLARLALAEHSPDLTDGEVRRSVGLLEGLLSVSIRQRESIARSIKDHESLASQISSLRTVTGPRNQVSLRQLEQDDTVSYQQLAWLPAILDVAAQVLGFQRMHSELPLQPLIAALQDCSTALRQCQTRFSSLPTIPDGLVSGVELQACQDVCTILLKLRTILEEWNVKELNVQYLTSQLLPWTYMSDESVQSMANGVHHISIDEIDDAAKASANSAFVALQQLANVKAQPVSSTEDPGWLAQSDKRFVDSWTAIHVPNVGEGVRTLLGKLQHVPTQDFPLAVSLVTVVTPILDQFHKICVHLLDTQALVHLQTCRLGIYLAKTFGTLATEGYCSPSDLTKGQEQDGKMESGTGLGDGEGAEDISKDVGDDEDLSEFATGEREEREGSIKGAEDAVDMGMDELEGETGELEEREGKEEDDGEDGEEGQDIDEETGSVDDLDPTAVDEKMWDDVKEEAEKEKEKEKELKGEKGKGERSDDQTAANEGAKEDGEDDIGELENGEASDKEINDDDEAAAGKAEAENADPHLQEEKALDLPEEMQLTGEEDGKDSDLSDDAMDELSDVRQFEAVDHVDEPDREEEKSLSGAEDAQDDEDEAERDGQAQDDEVVEDELPDGQEEKDHAEREDDMQYDEDGNGGGETGSANRLQDDIDPDQKAEGQNKNENVAAERQRQGGQATEKEVDGKMSQGTLERGQGRETTLERQQNEALKKLADVLDQWHQRREILNPSEDRQEGKLEADVDMAEVDFEHVEDEDEGDAQALGAARAEQAQNLDQSRAIQDETLVEHDTAMPDPQEQVDEDTVTQRLNRLQNQAGGERREDGSFMPDQHEKRDAVQETDLDEETNELVDETTSDIDRLELGQTQPPSALTTASDATQLWNYCSQATHQLSLILTEQLRLILSPTTATKLRGDYRTGKRLNLKRIIPYIASGYKRDKIWMRRSVPSKRNYQIMLAVDDSKSMSEGGADVLALQTTAMLCKSLAMLEVGDVSVLSFGEGGNEGIKIAHPFGGVWKGDESGIEVFRNFGFNQKGTDVRALMERGLKELREARTKVQGGREETWQLFLIISDGHCGEHERVRRLVREGKSERVLCVFIILDNLNTSTGDGEAGKGEQRKGESILDLKEAVFEPDPNREGEMRVATRRYLERFPFEFYLVVRDVRDLPGVLARCLRGWFGGVEGS